MTVPAPTEPAETFYERPIDRLTGRYTVRWVREGQQHCIKAHVRFTDYHGRPPSLYSVTQLPVVVRTWWKTRQGGALRPPLPLIVFDAIRHMEKVMPPGSRVLEIGGGNSTLWFISRGVRVTCIESSPEWADTVRSEAAQIGADDLLDLRVLTGDAAIEAVETKPDGSFDLLLVDSDSAQNWRADFTRVGPAKVRSGGWVVLDNSDHPNQWEAAAVLGEPDYRYTGYFPMGLVVSQTSFWRVQGRRRLPTKGRPTPGQR